MVVVFVVLVGLLQLLSALAEREPARNDFPG